MESVSDKRDRKDTPGSSHSINFSLLFVEVPQRQHDLHLDHTGQCLSLVPLEPSDSFNRTVDLFASFDLLGEKGQRKHLNSHDAGVPLNAYAWLPMRPYDLDLKRLHYLPNKISNSPLSLVLGTCWSNYDHRCRSLICNTCQSKIRAVLYDLS